MNTVEVQSALDHVGPLSCVINEHTQKLMWECNLHLLPTEIKAPLLLWFACAVLIAFSIYCALQLLLQSFPLTWRLRRLTKQMKKIPPIGAEFTGEGLTTLRALLEKDRLLGDSWNEFEETLLVETDEKGEPRVYNTRQAEEYFSEESIIDGRVNVGFYQALPGLLTGVGLLLTFVMILLGLSHIQPGEGGKIEGVQQLVFSLSGKFISSVTALLLATAFILLQHFTLGRLHGAYRKFTSLLNKRFSRMPTEHLLREIKVHIAQQSIALRALGTDLSGHLKEGLQEGMGPITQRIVTVLEEISKQKSESLSTSVSELVGKFQESLMGSARNEFGELASVLKETAAVLSEMNNQTRQGQAQMTALISGLESVSRKQADAGEEHLAKMSAGMTELIQKLNDGSKTSVDSMSEMVKSLVTKVDETGRAQLGEMKRVTADLDSSLRSLTEHVSKASQASTASVESSVTNLVERTEQMSSKTFEQLSGLFESNKDTGKLLSDAQEYLAEALKTFKRSVDDGVWTLERLDGSSKTLLEATSKLRGSQDEVKFAQERTSALADLAQKNLTSLQTTIDRQREVLASYEGVFGEIDKNLAGVLNQIRDAMESYSAKVRDTLETYITQFDRTFGDAASKLGSTVQELNESLEDVVEISAKARVANL